MQTVLTEMSELSPPETLANPELEALKKRILEEAPKPSFVPDAVSYMYLSVTLFIHMYMCTCVCHVQVYILYSVGQYMYTYTV